MKRYFYHHLVDVQSIIVELDSMDLSEHERTHLAALIDLTLHHTLLEAILSELSPEDQLIFLEHLRNDDHDKVWQHLNEKIDNIEEKIKQTADALKQELHSDIKISQKLKVKSQK